MAHAHDHRSSVRQSIRVTAVVKCKMSLRKLKELDLITQAALIFKWTVVLNVFNERKDSVLMSLLIAGVMTGGYAGFCYHPLGIDLLLKSRTDFTLEKEPAAVCVRTTNTKYQLTD